MRFFRFVSEGSNSFHRHDAAALDHLAIPREGEEILDEVDADVNTLDRWTSEHDVVRVDAMKLDTQGHELQILRGAVSVLSSVRAIEVEVCFNPIMDGTPLYGEVDRWLRERDFVLWRFRELTHYPLAGGEGAPGTIESQSHYGHTRLPTLLPTACSAGETPTTSIAP